MSTRPSITSTRSFQARLLEAETWRIALIAACFFVLLATWTWRRAAGGVVASANSVFIPIASVLVAAIALLLLAFIDTARRRRRGRPLPWWRLITGALLDLGAPFAILLILHLGSPRGAYAALSGPSLLLIPIVIMLSVLRLHPRFSLALGLCAALAHWALTASTIRAGNLPPDLIPLLTTYGVLLALTGAAAAVLAHFVRRYIHEAATEAEAAQLAAGKLSEIEHELNIAREIQQGLLPSGSPRLAGFDIAGMARPATQTGGDYFDWQPLPDGRLVVAIADVTGHGIGPALVMAVCRAYARATAPTTRSAAELLERMNNLIVQDVTGGRFITMAVALLSPDGSVELLSAGHGPTFRFRAADGRIDQFGGNGIPLGIADDEHYDPTEFLRLEPGDALVLLTDGFMERARPDGELFGIDRLSTVIAQNAARPATDLIAAMDAEATTFANGAPQSDDMTAVVLRRL